jgi:ABC-2 type transport system permease protein
MNSRRVAALMTKELREMRSNPAAILPVVLLVAVCLVLPFFVAIVLPAMTGERLSSDRTIAEVLAFARTRLPGLDTLPPESAAQAFLFQQFLFLFLVAPIVGAVSLAAYAVVGEKQGRTLEPLLTTPLTTAELLVSKVLAAFLPALVIEFFGLALYVMLTVSVAAPGVARTLISGRSLILIALLGPLASLAALQLTIAISSRVNDPRSAQQIAVLLVLPLVLMLVGQVAGAFVITSPMLLALCAGLAIVWLLLVFFSVALFDRESILTRWK